MDVHAIFDAFTSTLTYVILDEASRDAVVVDPVLDFDPASGRTGLASVERVRAYLKDRRATLRLILETHAHADHLSGCQALKHAEGDVPLAIGSGIREVQTTFKRIFDLPASFSTTGRQFDRLLEDGDVLHGGTLRIEVIATPGHTSACCSFLIGDALFTGDTLFMPDAGTGRCDFPGGDARRLHRSVQRLYALPQTTRTFTGHDYQPNGRPLAYESTVGEHRTRNIHLRADTSEDEFVAFREARDRTLDAPKLLYPSIQVNIDAGRLPEPAPNGLRYLRIPLDLPARSMKGPP